MSGAILLDGKYVLFAHLSPHDTEARFHAMSVIELMGQGDKPHRRWTFNLPTLRKQELQSAYVMSKPSISSTNGDWVISVQMNIWLPTFAYTSMRVITLWSKLKGYLNDTWPEKEGGALPGENPEHTVYPWSVWAPKSTRMFDWTYGHGNENGLHTASGTRIIRHGAMLEDVRVAERFLVDIGAFTAPETTSRL